MRNHHATLLRICPPFFVTSNYFTEHVKPHKVIWNWSFTWHATTITTFSFLFCPQWIFISQTDRKAEEGGKEKRKRTFSILLLYGAIEIPPAKHNTDWKRSGKRLSGAWQEQSAVSGQVKAALEDKQFMCYQCRRENSSSLH